MMGKEEEERGGEGEGGGRGRDGMLSLPGDVFQDQFDKLAEQPDQLPRN